MYRKTFPTLLFHHYKSCFSNIYMHRLRICVRIKYLIFKKKIFSKLTLFIYLTIWKKWSSNYSKRFCVNFYDSADSIIIESLLRNTLYRWHTLKYILISIPANHESNSESLFDFSDGQEARKNFTLLSAERKISLTGVGQLLPLISRQRKRTPSRFSLCFPFSGRASRNLWGLRRVIFEFSAGTQSRLVNWDTVLKFLAFRRATRAKVKSNAAEQL